MTEMLTGSEAVARTALRVQPDVVSAYPITPQTGIVETLAELDADGALAGEFLKVDSEFNAASACIGASAAGARVFSATCSQGLKLMSEPLFTAAGMRLPVVMAVANRSLSAPISIWNDHTDAFAERDGGMIQLFAADVQEAVDNLLMAYRVAEEPEISLPALSNMDGFILTHSTEPVDVPTEREIADYLPPREPHATLDPSDPVSMGPLVKPEHWTETRYAVHDGLVRSKTAIAEATASFADTFGREYGLEYDGLVETTGPREANIALVALGSLAGTIEHVMRTYSEPVRLVRPRVIRPFPAEKLRQALVGIDAIGVLQKEVSPGYQGSLLGEIKSALYGVDEPPAVRGYVVGLAGRDVSTDDIESIIADVTAGADRGHPQRFSEEEQWPQLDHSLLERTPTPVRGSTEVRSP